VTVALMLGVYAIVNAINYGWLSALTLGIMRGQEPANLELEAA
jgi:hypothetical protein